MGSRKEAGRRMARGRAAVAAVAAMAAGLHGCATAQQFLFAPRLKECEGFEAPLSILAVSSRKELRVRVQGYRVDQDIPFVVEADADSMVIVGFTPVGTKAFTLERNVDDVKVESVMGPALPVPPRNLMADLLAMSVPSGCAAGTDPVATTTVGDWLVSDTCGDARPAYRRISRAETGVELDIEYLSDSIVVKQHKCRYNARYVLQASAPIVAAPAASAASAAAPVPATSAPAAPAASPAAAATPAAPAKSGTATAAPSPAPSAAPAQPAKPVPAAKPAPARAPSKEKAKNAAPSKPATAPTPAGDAKAASSSGTTSGAPSGATPASPSGGGAAGTGSPAPGR